MAVTIKDVAALASVSPSTVSRVCNNNPSISAETKERVRRAMAEIGYTPNFQASNLATQNSRTIGIILPASEKEVYENPFYLEAIRGVNIFCNKNQYMSTIITGQTSAEILNVIRSMPRSGQVEGYIVMYSRQNDPVVDYLYNEGLLYVLIGKAHQNANQTIYVDNDNLTAGIEATEYLIDQGHSQIAYLGSDLDFIFSSERKSGYQFALTRHHIPLREDYCVEVHSIPHEDTSQLKELLSREDRPTAIVVSDDILAVALERICLELDLACPRDLSIISFNNSLFAKLTSPELTSIDVNACQLGIEAASQMINHIENPNLLATKIIVPHFLIERNSCRKIS